MKPFRMVRDIFNSPTKVAVICLFFLFSVLVADGSLLHLWSLYQTEARMTQEIASLDQEIIELNEKVHRAKQPEFVKKQARDHFDLLEKDEIVFVFTE